MKIDYQKVLLEYNNIFQDLEGKPCKELFDRLLDIICDETNALFAELLLFQPKPTSAGLKCGLSKDKPVLFTFHTTHASSDLVPMLNDNYKCLIRDSYNEISIEDFDSEPKLFQNLDLTFNIEDGAGKGIKSTGVISIKDKKKQNRGIFVYIEYNDGKRVDINESQLNDVLKDWVIGDGTNCIPMPSICKSTLFVPFSFLKEKYRGSLILGLQNDKVELTEQNKKRLNFIGEILGNCLTTSFCLVQNKYINNLHKDIIKAHQLKDKMEAICNCAAILTSESKEDPNSKEVPNGSYAHIRSFIPIISKGYTGILSMVANAGYTKSVDQLQPNQRNRNVPPIPDTEEDLNKLINGFKIEDRSVSQELYLRSEFWASKKDKGDIDDVQYAQKKVNLKIVEQVKLIHSEIAGRGDDGIDVSNITGLDNTLSLISVPIYDTYENPMGTLTLNSNRYGWLNFIWVPIVEYLAEEAAIILMYHHGMTMERNVSLKIKPESRAKVFGGSTGKLENGLDADKLENLLQGIFRDNWLYKDVDISLLEGYGKGHTFEIAIDRIAAEGENRTFRIILRVLPRKIAAIESRKYELLKTILDVGRFTAKIGEEIEYNFGAIAYLLIGANYGSPAIRLEKIIDNTNDKASISIDRFLDFSNDIWYCLNDLFNDALKSLHRDGKGSYGQDDNKPNILALYERQPPAQLTSRVTESLRYLFDTENPGLFDIDKLKNAKQIWCSISEVSQFIDKYLQSRDKIATLIKDPLIGLCHGDLNPRNVLVHENQCWIIDYDHFHRGHVLQDFARLESYITQLLLTNENAEDPNKALKEISLDWRTFFPPIKSGYISVNETTSNKFIADLKLKYNKIQSIYQHYGFSVTCYLAWRLAIRRLVCQLCDDLHKAGQQDAFNAEKEYKLALVFQYLDWTTFQPPKGNTGQRDRHIKGLKILSTEGLRILNELLSGN